MSMDREQYNFIMTCSQQCSAPDVHFKTCHIHQHYLLHDVSQKPHKLFSRHAMPVSPGFPDVVSH